MRRVHSLTTGFFQAPKECDLENGPCTHNATTHNKRLRILDTSLATGVEHSAQVSERSLKTSSCDVSSITNMLRRFKPHTLCHSDDELRRGLAWHTSEERRGGGEGGQSKEVEADLQSCRWSRTTVERRPCGTEHPCREAPSRGAALPARPGPGPPPSREGGRECLDQASCTEFGVPSS